MRRCAPSHTGRGVDVLELSDEVVCLHLPDVPARAMPSMFCIHDAAMSI